MAAKIKSIKKFIKIWLMVSSRSAQIQLLTNWSGFLFIIGKVINFLMFFVFLFAVLSSAKTLAGYSREQVILFFLVFSLVDILVQLFFRGTYRFRHFVVSGDYDLDLLKPLPSFFRPLFGWTDILDFVTLIPLAGYFLWFSLYFFDFPAFRFFAFFALLLNSLFIGFAFHLFVSGVGLLTLEIDHLVWVYRDLTSMARFPTDIYRKGIRYVLTFTIPVVVLVTVPAKALLGVLSWGWILLAFVVGGILLWASLKFWGYALSRYSSASS